MRLAIIVGLLIATTTRPVYSSDHNVAPNTVKRAFDQAINSVVKLYGGGGLGRLHGYGTGFLISPDGEIITALSILVTRPTIRVTLSDGRNYEARLVRSDEYRQLAVLKIDEKDLPYLNLVKTDSLEPGDTVIAMGNWYKVAEGDEPVSVNRGILSLKTDLAARRLTQDFDYQGPVLIYDAITSNPGAPGGPLLDIDGNCVGMIGRVVEAVSTNTRINYALPSEEITAFLGGEPSPKAAPSDKTSGSQSKGEPYVGIKISKFGFRHVSAYVQRVRPGSPAAEAGIKPDDLIVAVNGRRITNADAYKAAVKDMSPGQIVAFIVKRGNRVISVDVTVGAKP